MEVIARRSFLSALAALPLAALADSAKTSSGLKVDRVLNGDDRLHEHHIIGVSSTAFKVLTPEAHGGLFMMEHANEKKGGPSRHLHHNEDEWFYVLQGDYIAEIGGERFRLKAGDSVLGPREIPHAWAFVGDTPGRMLIAFAPANKMEEFFRFMTSRSTSMTAAQQFHAYGMELVGPPLAVD